MSLSQSMNLDSVMSHLSRMSPQQLQQFAAMHKEDPIMLAAASSVKNRMDKLQQAPQGQQGPQPPVNEQVVQSMGPQGQQGMPLQGGPQASQQLPEQQGIGALPAPNMQRMAGGGIVAFADGGFMDEEPVLRMAEGGVPRFADGVYVGEGNQYYAEPLTAEELSQRKPSGRLKAFAEWAGRNTEVDPVTGEVTSKTPTRTQVPAVSAAYPDEGRRGAMTGLRAPIVSAAPAEQGGLGVTAPGRAGPGRPVAAPAAPAPQDYRALMSRYMAGETADPFAAQRGDVAAAREAASREAMSEYDTGIAKQGDVFKTREARIGQRESELGKQKDLNKDMALIEAGLAMMQSSGRGLSGIAAGAAVGTKAYASGIERLRSAQEKLDEARDKTEELRLNYDTMNARERRGLTKEARDNVVQAKKDVLTGLEQAQGLKHGEAIEFLKLGAKERESQLERASREKIANMQANATPAQMQLISALGGGDFRKGYEVFKLESMLPKMMDDYTKRSTGIDADPAFKQKYPTFETYKAAMLGGGSGNIIDVPSSAAGAVRPR